MKTSAAQANVKRILLILSCGLLMTSHAMDTDGDGVQDEVDNCLLAPNPSQLDVDADLLGNACDGDFDNNGVTNFLDFNQLANSFLSNDPVVDLNGDGVVNFLDVSLFTGLFNSVPGPGAAGASYAGSAQQILAAKCAPCHTGLGFGGNNVAVNYNDALNQALNPFCGGGTVGDCTIVRIQNGSMPPNFVCTGNPITDAGNFACLSYDEQIVISSWVNGGLAP